MQKTTVNSAPPKKFTWEGILKTNYFFKYWRNSQSDRSIPEHAKGGKKKEREKKKKKCQTSNTYIPFPQDNMDIKILCTLKNY